jgi:hypothetical protein
VLDPITTSVVVISTAETTNALALDGTVREKEPSAFDVVPVVVPFTITDALATGLPLSSVTFPVMVRCASAKRLHSTKPVKSSICFLMCMCFSDEKKYN